MSETAQQSLWPTEESETSSSSLAGSPARTSARRVVERVSLASAAAYGASSLASLATFDPDSRSWKTSGGFEQMDSAPFLETLPRSGMTRSGTAYLLPPLARIIYGTGCGSSLLPTPTASDWRNCSDYSDGSRGHSPQLRHLGTGRLNPRFVEQLMGYPLDWTDPGCTGSATQLFQPSSPPSGER